MTDRPSVADIAKLQISDHVENYGQLRRPIPRASASTTGEEAVTQAVVPERSPILSLVIDQGVIDLTIAGDVEHLTITGRVKHLDIAK